MNYLNLKKPKTLLDTYPIISCSPFWPSQLFIGPLTDEVAIKLVEFINRGIVPVAVSKTINKNQMIVDFEEPK